MYTLVLDCFRVESGFRVESDTISLFLFVIPVKKVNLSFSSTTRNALATCEHLTVGLRRRKYHTPDCTFKRRENKLDINFAMHFNFEINSNSNQKGGKF